MASCPAPLRSSQGMSEQKMAPLFGPEPRREQPGTEKQPWISFFCASMPSTPRMVFEVTSRLVPSGPWTMTMK